MECLRDYIGIRGCGTTVPPSGIYLQDLEGISLKSLNSMADSQQINFVGVYRDIQTRALLRLKDDFTAAIGKRYRMKTVLDTVSIPKSNTVFADGILTADPNSYVGFMIDLDYNTPESEFITSPLTAPYVQQLFFCIADASDGDTVSFIIRDMDTDQSNQFLWVKNQQCFNGWNTIEVNQVFTNNYYDKSRKLFVGYLITTNNGTISPAVTNVPKLHTSTDCCQMRLTGGYIDANSLEFVETEMTYGLAAIVGVRCDLGSVVCTNKDLFKRTLLYALGAETMKEQIYTDRLNEYSMIRRNNAAELLEKFNADYTSALNQVAAGIELGCDCCLDCGGTQSISIHETV